MQVFKKIGVGLAGLLASLNVYADYSWNFPELCNAIGAGDTATHDEQIYDHYCDYFLCSIGYHDLLNFCTPQKQRLQSGR